MTNPETWPLLLTLPASLGGGFLLGLIYFRAVRMTADLIVSATQPALTFALILGRVVLLCASLYLTLQIGALALIAMLAGILAGRFMTLHFSRITAT